jgi:hypothetical protein
MALVKQSSSEWRSGFVDKLSAIMLSDFSTDWRVDETSRCSESAPTFLQVLSVRVSQHQAYEKANLAEKAAPKLTTKTIDTESSKDYILANNNNRFSFIIVHIRRAGVICGTLTPGFINPSPFSSWSWRLYS